MSRFKGENKKVLKRHNRDIFMSRYIYSCAFRFSTGIWHTLKCIQIWIWWIGFCYLHVILSSSLVIAFHILYLRVLLYGPKHILSWMSDDAVISFYKPTVSYSHLLEWQLSASSTALSVSRLNIPQTQARYSEKDLNSLPLLWMIKRWPFGRSSLCYLQDWTRRGVILITQFQTWAHRQCVSLEKALIREQQLCADKSKRSQVSVEEFKMCQVSPMKKQFQINCLNLWLLLGVCYLLSRPGFFAM